jgi:hypothetical protein
MTHLIILILGTDLCFGAARSSGIERAFLVNPQHNCIVMGLVCVRPDPMVT